MKTGVFVGTGCRRQRYTTTDNDCKAAEFLRWTRACRSVYGSELFSLARPAGRSVSALVCWPVTPTIIPCRQNAIADDGARTQAPTLSSSSAAAETDSIRLPSSEPNPADQYARYRWQPTPSTDQACRSLYCTACTRRHSLQTVA